MPACCSDAGVAQLVERNLAKVEVESSRLFSRSKKCWKRRNSYPWKKTFFLRYCWSCKAGVAQLVERNLAKVEVESSRLFSRSSVSLDARMVAKKVVKQ